MNLSDFDHIVLNTSAGKDSQTMIRVVVAMAKAQGVVDRILAVHADLGQVEWEGTKELAQEQAEHHGIPLQIVQREKGDLLAQVKARRMWPDSANRYCTSDQKRDQIAKVIRHLPGSRVLNCLGFRADESPSRAKRKALSLDTRLTTSTRTVTVWLPIHSWTLEQVWADIRASGVRSHRAYALGLPRLSCVFCIFAPPAALLLAGKHNRPLLDRYVELETEIGHDFRHGFKIARIASALDVGESLGPITTWRM